MKHHALRLDRRGFILASAAAAASVTPLARAIAAAFTPASEPLPAPLLADWTIDDMWGVYPRPSEPIGFGRPHGDGELIAAVHPVDAPFLV